MRCTDWMAVKIISSIERNTLAYDNRYYICYCAHLRCTFAGRCVNSCAHVRLRVGYFSAGNTISGIDTFCNIYNKIFKWNAYGRVDAGYLATSTFVLASTYCKFGHKSISYSKNVKIIIRRVGMLTIHIRDIRQLRKAYYLVLLQWYK